MKTLTYAIIFILCMNMATWMLSNIDVPWGVGFNTSITPEEVIERYNLNQTASGWTGEEGEVFFGYIYTGIRLLMNSVITIFVGFPYMLQSMGAPYWIWAPLYAIWCFLGILWFIELITGREIMG